MIEKVMRCDLCKDQIRNSPSEVGVLGLRKTNGRLVRVNEWLAAEFHVCRQCGEDLKAVFVAKLDNPPGPKPDAPQRPHAEHYYRDRWRLEHQNVRTDWCLLTEESREAFRNTIDQEAGH